MTKNYGKFMAKVIKVDRCSIIFHISCAHCILGICALHFVSICRLKLRILLAIHELNLLPCSLSLVAIIFTCQIFLHYNTSIINKWTTPTEPIFLGGPPFLVKYSSWPTPFFASTPPVINNEWSLTG
jgi:hypothetical protein